MKKAAVICSKGIGDGLLMLITSHQLQKQGYLVTTYHPTVQQFSTLLAVDNFSPFVDDWKKELLDKKYDLIILQNENTKKAREIRSLYLSGVIDHLVIFYASHEPEKHPPVLEHDYLFDSELTMAENIAIATKKLLNLPEITKDNGLFPIKGNTHRKYSKRIVIHPTSTEKERIWDQAKFFKVAKTLQKKGYEVAFCLTEKEQLGFVEANQLGIQMPKLSSLEEVARFIYESGYLIGNDSGMGHLASNLQIPTLIISNNAKRLKMWRPGFKKGVVICPSKHVPNLKGFKIRERCWRAFISPKKALRAFNQLAHI